MRDEKNIRTYDRGKCAVFLRTKDEWGGFSNMAGGFQLSVGGVGIRTSEALYQACRFPRFTMIQQEIIDQASPIAAKMKARRSGIESLIRPDWMSVRLTVMRWVLRVKLAQNWSTFGSLLTLSGEMPIVEESSKGDDYWGVIPKVGDGGTLIGVNALGRLLMELRQELREKGESMKVVETPDIEDFLFLGEKIGRISAVTP
jgi:type I restriction enzyme S subunit